MSNNQDYYSESFEFTINSGLKVVGGIIRRNNQLGFVLFPNDKMTDFNEILSHLSKSELQALQRTINHYLTSKYKA